MAFADELDEIKWYVMFNYVIDILFAVDILVNFNSAIVDEEFKIIDDRSVVACTYLKGWFLIDLISIVPFELLTNILIESEVTDDESVSPKVNQLVRITRISKLYKLVKILKLMRLFKWVKKRKEISKKVLSVVKTGAAIDRVIFFFMTLLIMCHFFGCLWIFLGRNF
jgi:hypothetical protein